MMKPPKRMTEIQRTTDWVRFLDSIEGQLASAEEKFPGIGNMDIDRNPEMAAVGMVYICRHIAAGFRRALSEDGEDFYVV